VEDAVNRSIGNANRITLGTLARGVLCGLVVLLAACTQGPGGGGIGLGSGQDPDPATVDFPIFYIRHQVPEEQDDVTRHRPFVEDEEYSATLWKRDRASPGAAETEITARLRTEEFGGTEEDRYDIKHLAASLDGLKVAFAMRGPLGDFDEDETPTWNIWEYNIETDVLRRVIPSDIVAEDGQDVSPAYLPDGRIVFSSTRQRQSKAILLDEGKAQYEATTEDNNESAFVLHVMNADGTDVHQITFNRSHDTDATVLQNGRVLFTRWESVGNVDGLHLYTTNPDGTDTQLHYGALSHDTGTPANEDPDEPSPPIEFTRAREMSDGRLMVLARERTDVDFGGDLIIIDANRYVENTQPLQANAGLPGPAQVPATLNEVRTIPGPSPGGRFQSGFPLWDGSGRILVSWSQCRLLDVDGSDPTRIVPCDPPSAVDAPNAQAAAPLYSVWMFDPAQNTILPVMQPVEGVMVTEAIALQPRVPLPAVIVDRKAPGELDADLVSEGAGLLSIGSVYDIMGTDQARLANNAVSTISAISNPSNPQYANRQVRFIRIEKKVSMPDDDDIVDPDNSAFGQSNEMREILGYAPVEPDGSVRMKVPANVAFQLSLLDANGRALPNRRHNAWLSVRPGETLECIGCHTRATDTPRSHGRKGSFDAFYAGSLGGTFPGTPATIFADPGDTMARARQRATSSCPSDPMNPATERCGLAAVTPSVNVIYDEIWKPAALPDESFIFSYSQVPVSPANPATCVPWTPTCRITIHYQSLAGRPGHIHPMWSAVRQASSLPGNPTGIDTNNDGIEEETYSCISCHNRIDVVNQTLLPAASLELTDEISNEDALQLRAYRQLLITRNELELDVNGAVVERLVQLVINGVPQVDDNGNPVMVPVPIAGTMRAFNSRGSPFFNIMNNATHAGMLTPGELRLISEWLDIGAQYYNDPFPPTPQN
jgi:hypothetical protein